MAETACIEAPFSFFAVPGYLTMPAWESCLLIGADDLNHKGLEFFSLFAVIISKLSLHHIQGPII